MLRIKINKGENITRALKKFKQKVRDTKLLQKLREKKQYDKPSAKRRKAKQKAIVLTNGD